MRVAGTGVVETFTQLEHDALHPVLLIARLQCTRTKGGIDCPAVVIQPFEVMHTEGGE